MSEGAEEAEEAEKGQCGRRTHRPICRSCGASSRRLVLYSHLGMAMSVMFVFSVLPLLDLPHHYKR